MTDYLADILKDRLIGQPGIEKISGNTVVLTKEDVLYDKDNNEIGTMTLRYPIADKAQVSDCEETGELFVPMIPDSKFKSVSYFEDNGTRQLQRGEYETKIRYVWWGNLYHLGELDTARNLPTLVQANVIKELCGQPFNAGIMQRININVDNIPPKSNNIFSKYTYKETDVQYLLHPYDYFAIDFLVTYRINPKCLNDIILNSPVLCDFSSEPRQFGASHDPSFS